MPKNWQIVHKRSEQTQGVWALDDGFTVRDLSKDMHEDHAAEVRTAAEEEEEAADVMDSAEAAVRGEYVFFESMNSAIGQRLDSEVPDDDALQRDVDQITGIRQSGEAAIDDRTLKTIVCWKKINAARAAATPPLGAVTVRGVAVAAYETRWTALPGLRQPREVQAGDWRSRNSTRRTKTRRTDRENKDWYQAWKSEFPPGTPKGDALAGVDTETGTAPPKILEIAAVVQAGLSLHVTYVAGTGQHATVLDLQFKVDGVHVEWQRVTADVAAGNVLGPFTAGQVVHVRTDVGNSRDASELSPEQVVTIMAPP
jgi:ribosomal protein L11 methylase PrmA